MRSIDRPSPKVMWSRNCQRPPSTATQAESSQSSGGKLDLGLVACIVRTGYLRPDMSPSSLAMVRKGAVPRSQIVRESRSDAARITKP